MTYNIASTFFLMQKKTYKSSHFLINKYSAASCISSKEEAEDSLVCDEVLLIHSNDE